MKYWPIVLSLVCGLLLGCVWSSIRGPEAESPSPARHESTILPLVPPEETIDPVPRVGLESSLQDYDPAEVCASQMAHSRAKALHLAKRCREVPDEEIADVFDELVALEAKVDKSLALRILGERWSKFDPRAASEAAATLEPRQRSLVEHSMWQTWARYDLIGFRAHMKDLRHELKSRPPLGIPFGDPGPWMKADPSQAMEAMLDQDWYFFREIHSMPKDVAPPADARPLPEPPLDNARAWPGPPDMPPVLEGWFRSDLPSAMSWTRHALAREDIPPRLRFHVIHHLNQSGFHAEAAELAEQHLTEDLREIAIERIMRLWQTTDPEAAGARGDTH